MSQSQAEFLGLEDAELGEWGEMGRVKREASEAPSSTQLVPAADDDKPAKVLPKYALYNATGKATFVLHTT